MANKIAVLVYAVGKNPKVEEIEPTLEELQRLVNGYIEPISVLRTKTGGVIKAWINEEGRINGSKFNCLLGCQHTRIPIMGDFFFMAHTCSGGERSLTDGEIELVKQFVTRAN